MILMGLNIGLVASTIVSLWIYHSVPGILAISCGAIGGVTLFSRVKIWRTGVINQFYDLVRDNEEALKKMRTMDSLFWGTSVFNSGVFLCYLAWYIAGNFQIS